MKLTEQLYTGVQALWASYLEHPFVAEMAQGTLPPEKFRRYMLQDYLYLLDYAKVFAASILKADDFDTLRFLSENVSATLEETDRVHVPYMKQLGITDAEIAAAVPEIDNSSYTHYMICEAQAGGVLSGLVSILSCSWSYAYIAEQMVRRYPHAAEQPTYGPWFVGYLCPEYQATNASLMERVDRLAVGISDTEREKLCRIFETCSLHELRFWNMAYGAER